MIDAWQQNGKRPRHAIALLQWRHVSVKFSYHLQLNRFFSRLFRLAIKTQRICIIAPWKGELWDRWIPINQDQYIHGWTTQIFCYGKIIKNKIGLRHSPTACVLRKHRGLKYGKNVQVISATPYCRIDVPFYVECIVNNKLMMSSILFVIFCYYCM